MNSRLLDTHTMIVGTACTVIIMAALYFMLEGLIHDGSVATVVLDGFKWLIGILTGGATLSTIISQVSDYKKSKNGVPDNGTRSTQQPTPSA